MVQRGVQYNRIVFLLYIRKPIKNMYNQKNLKIVAWKKQNRGRI